VTCLKDSRQAHPTHKAEEDIGTKKSLEPSLSREGTAHPETGKKKFRLTSKRQKQGLKCTRAKPGKGRKRSGHLHQKLVRNRGRSWKGVRFIKKVYGRWGVLII